MKKSDRIEKLMEEEPWARELKNRNKAIRTLLLNTFPSAKFLGDSYLEEMIAFAVAQDRYHRAIRLEKAEEWKLDDVEDGYELAVDKMDELGYMVQPSSYTK